MPRIAAGFGKNIDDGIRGDVEKSGENAGNTIGTTIKRIALAAAGAFALDKVKDFVSGTISAASDLAETVGKSQVIFGAQAAGVEKWANSAATNLGLSKRAALEAAAGFGDMFSQIGFTGGQAAGMSKDVVQLATDLGAFNNLPTSDVLDMISGSLRGEYDSLQRVIPNISAARVQQEAMAATGKKNADQLTAQEKAAATLAIIHKDGARAAGNFKDTSANLAEQQKILSARIEDVKARIGQALLPIVVSITSFISGHMGPALDWLGGLFREIKLDVELVVAAFREGDVTSSGWHGTMEKLGNLIREVLPPIERIVDFVKANFVPILAGAAIGVIAFGVALWAATAAAAAAEGALVPVVATTSVAILPIVALAAGIALLVGGLIYAYTHFETFRDIVNAVAEAVSGFVMAKFEQIRAFTVDIWPQISEAITHVVNVISAVIRGVLTVVSAAWALFGDDLLRIASAVWDEIKAVIDFVLNTIEGVIRLVLAVINGDWGKAWDAVKSIFSGAWDFIVATAKNILPILLAFFDMQLQLAKTLFLMALDAIVGFFKALPGNLVKALEGLGRLIGDFVHWELTTAWHLAVLAFDAAVDFFQKLPGRLIGAAGDLAGIVGRWLRGQFDDAVDRTRGALDTMVGFFRDLPGRLAGVAGDVFGFLRESFKAAVNWIIDHWNRLEIPGFSVDLPGPLGHVGVPAIPLPDIPHLAIGGPLAAGMPAIVGERGTELFVPSRDGMVLPHDAFRELGTTKIYKLELSGTAYEPVDVTEQFHRMELLELPT